MTLANTYVEQLGVVESIQAKLTEEPLGRAVGWHPYEGI